MSIHHSLNVSIDAHPAPSASATVATSGAAAVASRRGRWWLVRFVAVWCRIRWLQMLRTMARWTDEEYYRKVYSIPDAASDRSSDKFASTRAAINDEIAQDPARARVLDLGCGFGFQARHMRASGYRHVYACDLVSYRVQHARELHGPDGVRYVAGDMRCLCLADRALDAIVISVALHDLTPGGVAAVLGECRRVLKPRGRLVIMEPRFLEDIPGPLHRWLYRRCCTLLDESINLGKYLDFDIAATLAQLQFDLVRQQLTWWGNLCIYTAERAA